MGVTQRSNQHLTGKGVLKKAVDGLGILRAHQITRGVTNNRLGIVAHELVQGVPVQWHICQEESQPRDAPEHGHLY